MKICQTLNQELRNDYIAAETTVGDTETEYYKHKLADTIRELSKTKEILLKTAHDLSETKKQLIETEGQLSETNDHITETEQQLTEEIKEELTAVKNSMTNYILNIASLVHDDKMVKYLLYWPTVI